MHYKNGREAHQGDPIVAPNVTLGVQVGMLIDVNAGAATCNGKLSRAIGECHYVTIGECYHAADAFIAADAANWGAKQPAPPAAAAPAETKPQNGDDLSAPTTT